MKCQSLGQIRKISNLSCIEFAQSVVKVESSTICQNCFMRVLRSINTNHQYHDIVWAGLNGSVGCASDW